MKKNNPESEISGSSDSSLPILTAGIGSRILEISSGFGDKKRLSEMTGISEAQFYRYIKGTSSPTIEPLARLADAAHVTLEWLATGRGPKLKADVGLYEKYDVGALAEAIETTEMALEAMKRRATPQKKAELVLLVYGVLASKETDKNQRSAAVLKLLSFAS